MNKKFQTLHIEGPARTSLRTLEKRFMRNQPKYSLTHEEWEKLKFKGILYEYYLQKNDPEAKATGILTYNEGYSLGVSREYAHQNVNGSIIQKYLQFLADMYNLNGRSLPTHSFKEIAEAAAKGTAFPACKAVYLGKPAGIYMPIDVFEGYLAIQTLGASENEENMVFLEYIFSVKPASGSAKDILGGLIHARKQCHEHGLELLGVPNGTETAIFLTPKLAGVLLPRTFYKGAIPDDFNNMLTSPGIIENVPQNPGDWVAYFVDFINESEVEATEAA